MSKIVQICSGFSVIDFKMHDHFKSRSTERVIADGLGTIVVVGLTLVGISFIIFSTNRKLALITMMLIPLLKFLTYLITIIARARLYKSQCKNQLWRFNEKSLAENRTGFLLTGRNP